MNKERYILWINDNLIISEEMAVLHLPNEKAVKTS